VSAAAVEYFSFLLAVSGKISFELAGLISPLRFSCLLMAD
jgi:hypothetical protein